MIHAALCCCLASNTNTSGCAIVMEKCSSYEDWRNFCEEEAGLIALLLFATRGPACIVIFFYDQGFNARHFTHLSSLLCSNVSSGHLVLCLLRLMDPESHRLCDLKGRHQAFPSLHRRQRVK